MKKWIKSMFAMLVMCISVLGVASPVFAYSEVEASNEPAIILAAASNEEKKSEETSRKSSEAFSVNGNGTVLDNIKDKNNTKEFYTITTANNNTFFIIIDHESTNENVYMLSMIDENDLKDFIEEEKVPEKKPAVVIDETPVKQEVKEPDVTIKEDKTTNNSMYMVVGIVALSAIAGAAYFKFGKGKKDNDFTDDEDLEYLDDGVMINEDETPIIEEDNEE